MSIPLRDALRMLDLEPGRVYRERVDGKMFVVQLLAESDDEPTPELADQVMLTPGAEPPPSDTAYIITVTRGQPMLPRPFHLDETDLAPGDLPDSEPG
jgi:hypothetical protein